MDDDRTLLTAYARDGSEEAFATLTRRYLDLVYSVALRQLRDPDQARDVTQAVFLLLARKAKALAPDTILAGWLYRTARFVSLEALRAEKRRKLREESMAIPSQSSPEEIWQKISPHLDDAMERIPESDRTAIILRYFEDQPLRQLAAALGLSEEAAKKKVSRALEKLRAVFARKGISSTSSLLGTALIASAIQPAPPALAAIIAAPAATGLPATMLLKGTIQMMTYTKLQAAAAAAVLLLMAGGTSYVGVQHAKAFHESRRDRDPFAQAENPRPTSSAAQNQLLAEARLQNQQLRDQARELYRLRDAVTRLRAQVQSAAVPPNSLNLQNAPRELQESAERLRELQYEHFVAAGQKAIALQPLTGLTDQEKASYAYEINLLKNIGLALRIYATDHGDEFPATIDSLLEGDLLQGKMKDALQTGKYEYIRFNRAESKPGLPAVWWRAPDENGIRLVALNDGSVQTIREPADMPKPGYLAFAESPKR